MRRFWRLGTFSVVALLESTYPDAQNAPRTVADIKPQAPALVADQLQTAASSVPFLSAAPLTVGKGQNTDAKLIGAQTIHFPDGSSLLISNRPGEPIVVMAEEIDLDGDATVSWSGLAPINQKPPPRGKAPDGQPGRGEGISGGPGADGEPGNAGYHGQSAPSLTIYVRVIKGGGKLTIDLRGQDGGSGGDGQDGGDGGPGAQGARASSSLFDCRRGPGKGGNGGPGGAAGAGGQGGAGGDGGNVTVITSDPSATTHLAVLTSGGKPGSPGKSGRPGSAGAAGGPGQNAPPFCNGGGSQGDRPAAVPPSPASTPDAQSGAGGLVSSVAVPDTQMGSLFSSAIWKK
jgi:hypothetical protein